MDNPNRNVTFPQAFVLFFKNYSTFNGRSNRSAFWWWGLASFLIGGIAAPVLDKFFFATEYESMAFFGGLWLLITIIPNLSLNVRRLHDSNRSGWWMLLYFTVIGIIPLIWWVCVSKSTEGANKYGDYIEAGLDWIEQARVASPGECSQQWTDAITTVLYLTLANIYLGPQRVHSLSSDQWIYTQWSLPNQILI